MIIDSHAHCDVRFGWQHTPEVLLRMMAQSKIDKAVITTYADIPGDDPTTLDRFIEALEKYPDKIVAGFIRLNPWYGEKAVELLEKVAERPYMKGLKLHPVSCIMRPNDAPVLALVKKAGDLGWPVYFHSGDEPMSMPSQVGKAAKACPATKIIMGHLGGFFYWKEAIETATKYDNIYCETSATPFSFAIRKAIDALGPERIIFGTDMPAMHPIVELKKIDAARLTEHEKRLVLCDNVKLMLGL
jgi:predicted TIM-barrel fold metal-dependent hydrolase